MDTSEEYPFVIISKIESLLSDDRAFIDFSKKIKESAEVLEILGSNISPLVAGFDKGKATHIYFAQHISAAIVTLDNIKCCAENWSFSDSFTLARKYRDVLFQCLFITNTILSYVEHCEKLASAGHPAVSSATITIEDIESLTQFFDYLTSESSRRPEDTAIILFLENFISVSEKKMIETSRKFFDAQAYKKILEDSNSTLKNCFVFLENIWKNSNIILNNYVHANGIGYITSNLKQYIFSDRDKLLSELSLVISNTTTMFLSIMILVDPASIRAPDHMEALEMGETPEEGSQYWVASEIQKFINVRCEEVSPELKKFLQEENKFGMHI